MLGSMDRRARESAAAHLVAAVPIWIASRIVDTTTQVLVKLDVVHIQMIPFRMLIVHR